MGQWMRGERETVQPKSIENEGKGQRIRKETELGKSTRRSGRESSRQTCLGGTADPRARWQAPDPVTILVTLRLVVVILFTSAHYHRIAFSIDQPPTASPKSQRADLEMLVPLVSSLELRVWGLGSRVATLPRWGSGSDLDSSLRTIIAGPELDWFVEAERVVESLWSAQGESAPGIYIAGEGGEWS
eukprot:1905821-Rhodomonas_salina.1